MAINYSTPAFTCPQCNFVFPRWKALLLTRWTRYTCPVCKSHLEPVIRDVELTGLFLGFIAGLGYGIIGFFGAEYFGFWTVLSALLIYMLFALFLCVVIGKKYVHLKEVS